MRPWSTLPRHLALIALVGAAGLVSAIPPCLAAPTAGAAKAKAAAPAEKDGRITLDFVEADLNDVAKALSVQSGMNIALSTQAKGKITLRLRHTTLEEALRFVSRLAGLDYRRFDDTYVIGTPAELRAMAARTGTTTTWTPQRLKADQAQTLVQAALPFVTVQAVPDSKHVLLLGSHDDLVAARRLLEEADLSTVVEVPTGAQPASRQVVTRVYQLKYLHPTAALRTVRGEGSEPGESKTFPGVFVTVGPEPFAPNPANFMPLSTESRSVFAGQSVASNKDSNGLGSNNGQTKARALVLTGPADQVAAAIDLLQQLDTAPPQVMIEARLVDISPEKTRELGLEYDWTQVTWREGPTRDPALVDNTGGTVDVGNKGGSGLKFGRFFRTPFDLTATLKALETQRMAKLLAHPKISVVDSEDASIFIGDLLRYRVLSSITPGGSEQFTVETVPVGVALLVRPRVHENEITLKVHPVVSTVTAFVGPERIPQTASREADTTFRMKDGETIALGGLIREEDLKIMRQVPLLGNLPIIGELFRSRTTSKRKSEVTVFLTARILRS